MRTRNFVFTLIGIFVVTLIISFLSFQLFSPGKVGYAPTVEPKQQSAVPIKVNTRTYLEENLFYKSCHHTVSRNIQNNNNFTGKSLETLQSEGYQIQDLGSGRFELTKSLEGLCPTDSEKRHITASNTGFTLYRGPLGYESEPIEEYLIDISLLPGEISEKLSSGGIEFISHADFLTLLESLDEFF